MADGAPADTAVGDVTGVDPQRGHRQIAALGRDGHGTAFTGSASVAVADALSWGRRRLRGQHAGQLRRASRHAPRMGRGARHGSRRPRSGVVACSGPSGVATRGGLKSAALLVLRPDAPPLDLRIDLSEAPLDDLESLLEAARTPPYADWLKVVPVARNPHRGPDAAPGAAE